MVAFRLKGITDLIICAFRFCTYRSNGDDILLAGNGRLEKGNELLKNRLSVGAIARCLVEQYWENLKTNTRNPESWRQRLVHDTHFKRRMISVTIQAKIT